MPLYTGIVRAFSLQYFPLRLPHFSRNILREFDNEVVPFFQQVNTIEIVLVNPRSDITSVPINSPLDVTPIPHCRLSSASRRGLLNLGAARLLTL